jgi:hypothetical protein
MSIEDFLKHLAKQICMCETIACYDVTLQRTNTKNWEKIVPGKELCGHSPNFHISPVCKRFIYLYDRSAYSAAGNIWTDPGNILIAHRHMNV